MPRSKRCRPTKAARTRRASSIGDDNPDVNDLGNSQLSGRNADEALLFAGRLLAGAAHSAPRNRARPRRRPSRPQAKKLEDGSDYLAINPKGAVPALAARQRRSADRKRGDPAVSRRPRNWPEVLPPLGDFRRYRVLEMVNYITTELHKRFGYLFSPDASDEMKQLVIRDLGKKLDYIDDHLGDGPFLFGDHSHPARPLSVRHDRLGREVHGPRQVAATSRAFRERMMDRAAGSPRAPVRRIAGRDESRARAPAAMSQFDLTDDQLQIQEMARKFTADAITPHAAEWDEKHIFPRDTIREAAELGFGVDLRLRRKRRHRLGPARSGADHGGDGLRLPSTSAFISIHNMACWMIDRFGSAEVKQKYLPVDDHDGANRQLLPDRAFIGLRCSRA